MLRKGTELFRKYDGKYYKVSDIDFTNQKILFRTRDVEYKYNFTEFGIDLFLSKDDVSLSIRDIARNEKYAIINQNLKNHLNNYGNYRYKNHCFKCNNKIDSFKHPKCNVCGWHQCPTCSSCGCNYNYFR